MIKEKEHIIIREEWFCDQCNEQISENVDLYKTGNQEGYTCDVCEKDYCIHCYPKKEVYINIKNKTYNICQNCDIKKGSTTIQDIDKYLRLKEELDKLGKDIIHCFNFKKYDLAGNLRKK